jgi:hypothetical protein
MTSTDLAWAAGLFEGEGCLYEVTGQALPHLSLTLEMRDLDIVERFLGVLRSNGVQTRAKISTRWRGNENHSRQYAVKITGKPAEHAYMLLRHNLGERRRARGDEILSRRRQSERDNTHSRICVGCRSVFDVPPTSRRKVWCTSECYHRELAKTPRGRELANARKRRYRQRQRDLANLTSSV